MRRRADGEFDRSVALTLSPVRDMIRLDEPIELQLTFVNVSDHSFYISRSYSIGTHDIEISARQGTCEYNVSGLHATVFQKDKSFLLTPLMTRERFTQPVIRINDIESAGAADLLFPHAGKYSMRAAFHSEGDPVVDGREPVWRGTVTSDPVTLTVLPPSIERVDRMRGLLEEALKNRTLNPVSLAHFRYVRDPAAADLLVRLVNAVG